MYVTINYKARLSWGDDKGYHHKEMCEVTHEIERNDFGKWDTINFDWKVCEEQKGGDKE